MCHHFDDSFTPWYEDVKAQAEARAETDQEPPEVDLAAPEIETADLDEESLSGVDIEEPELDD